MAGKLRPDTSPARSSHSFPRLTRLKNRPGTSEPYVGNRQTKTCTSQSQRQGQRPGIARTQRHDASCSVDTSKESQVLLPAHHRRRHASLPDFWGPDQSQQLRYSKAKPVRDIIERIKQHCPPSHNWEVRRRELQLRIEEGLKEQYAVTDRKVCKQDKVWENAAFVWVHSLPFVRRARIAQLLCAHEEEVHCVAKRRAKCIHDREVKMAASQDRILRWREERIARETLQQRMHQKVLWLQALWAGAVQIGLGKEVIAQRQARRDLANQHMHIIQIQAYIRMWIARRKYLEIKKATKYIQQCVRRFLRSLFLSRRREAATVIIGFMTMAHNADRLTHAFHRMLHSIHTLRQYIQQYCLVRDARRMMLKMQWLRWEAQHHRRILKDIHFRGTPLASEPKGSVVRDLDFALVNDTIKQQVVRQHLHSRMQEWVQSRRDVQRARERLSEHYGTTVLLEKCLLLGINPSENKEYMEALAKVNAEAPEIAPLKIMECSITISRLHKQGMKIQASQKPVVKKGVVEDTAGAVAAPARPPKA